MLYDLTDEKHRVDDVEILVHESWQIASTRRSSTTREYIGAVDDLESLRLGRGEFESAEKFYKYWRKFNFKTGKAVEKQLAKLLAQSSASGK